MTSLKDMTIEERRRLRRVQKQSRALIDAMRNEKITYGRSLNVRHAQEQLARTLGVEWRENR